MAEENNVKLPKPKTIKTLYKYDTEYSADSVEWCPHSPHKNYFVCGNYQLAENEKGDGTPQKRLGRILLFSINPQSGLELHQTIDTAAVLDQKWCHNKIEDFSILGVVTAEKKIEMYKLESKKLELITYFELQANEKVLLLSLDWSTGKYSSEEPTIVCSDSKGNYHIFQFTGNKISLLHSCNTHNFEAWIAGFYYWDPNVFFTGGDDCLFLKYDLRTGTSSVVKNQEHEAGVTSFHSNIKKEFIVVSGSYDNNVRIWDIRKMKTPVNKIQMPGTLWRLKFDPFECRFLLAACMLDGAHVIDTVNVNNLKIVESYYEHKNLTYGSDWCFLDDKEVNVYDYSGNVLIGTCSFYDHLLCVSKLSLSFTPINDGFVL